MSETLRKFAAAGVAGAALVVPAAAAEYTLWDDRKGINERVATAQAGAETAEDALKAYVNSLTPKCADAIGREATGTIPEGDALITTNQVLVNSGVCESDTTSLTTPLITASRLGLEVESADDDVIALNEAKDNANSLGTHAGALVLSYLCAGGIAAGVTYALNRPE